MTLHEIGFNVLEEIFEDLSQDTYYPGRDWHP